MLKTNNGKFSNKKLMFTGGFQNMSRSEAKRLQKIMVEKFLVQFQKN